MDIPIHPVYNVIPNRDTLTHIDALPADTTTDHLVSPQIEGEDTFDLFRNQVSHLKLIDQVVRRGGMGWSGGDVEHISYFHLD